MTFVFKSYRYLILQVTIALFCLQGSLVNAQHISLVRCDSVQLKAKDFSGKLYVHLPRNYSGNSTVKYPVIYVLDPEYRFAQTVLAVETLSSEANESIPESIIIGVPSNDRYRDFTQPAVSTWSVPEFIKEVGGSEKFINYLIREIIPFIEKNYQASSNRTIIGHSLGGLLSLEIFTKMPGVFFGYILLDPSTFWNAGAIVDQAERAIPKVTSEVRVFLADGLVPEGMDVMLEPNQKRLEDLLKEVNNEKVIYTYKGLRGETHNQMPYQAIYLGLKAIFFDYQPPAPWKLSESQVGEYYNALSARYGFQIHVPKMLGKRGRGRN